ncbi:MAG: hypothetical protein KME42_13940 [Tildeniella nuda ZEHNDER 1965/U140]|jgi:hypothetical protein|nr:hypothetical protein [Tildeniella nuda ZEHNDER 1965/U140]
MTETIDLIAKYRLTIVPDDEDDAVWYAGVFSYDYFSTYEIYAALEGELERLGTGRTIDEAVTAAVALIEAANSALH